MEVRYYLWPVFDPNFLATPAGHISESELRRARAGRRGPKRESFEEKGIFRACRSEYGIEKDQRVYLRSEGMSGCGGVMRRERETHELCPGNVVLYRRDAAVIFPVHLRWGCGPILVLFPYWYPLLVEDILDPRTRKVLCYSCRDHVLRLQTVRNLCAQSYPTRGLVVFHSTLIAYWIPSYHATP